MGDEKSGNWAVIQPEELQKKFPVVLADGVISDTHKVWQMMVASCNGNIHSVKELIVTCPQLAFAQYNYAPPIHFAVREGHAPVVELLLSLGAFDPSYRTYFFVDSLVDLARDRKFTAIATALENYISQPPAKIYRGDNGEILYARTDEGKAFEKAVDVGDLATTRAMLGEHPEFAKDNTFFWGEGILMMPAKDGNFKMMELLLEHGASFPAISKWPQAYYFEKYESAKFVLEHGMSANHSNCHRTTILHFVAKENDVEKAKLLLDHGAVINAIDEEYLSTPLGIASKYGNVEMIEFLVKAGADPKLAGAEWATPLQWAKNKGHREIEIILST